ncbi:MAG: electron transfer flavoprotein subunit beta/FixA family protein [Firmicutes bacterium]|nr:electron transfer flavoprotein subunit beta/FixA family protein [Bacillota bacterium]
MVILVLVKPVPDPEKYNEIQIDPQTKRILRQDAAAVLDPASKCALEEALRIKSEVEAASGDARCEVIALSMAPQTNRDKILECLAMGADAGYLLSDPAFGGADTYATSYVLAEGAKAILAAEELDAFDLIIAGNESADGATSHVPVQVAEWLGLPHLARVCELQIQREGAEGQEGAGGTPVIAATKKTEEMLLTFRCEEPALVAVTRDINKPRHISAMGIVKARKKPLTIWTNDDLKLDEAKIGAAGSPTKAGELMTPDLSRGGRDLTEEDGSAADAAKAILALLRKEGLGA